MTSTFTSMTTNFKLFIQISDLTSYYSVPTNEDETHKFSFLLIKPQMVQCGKWKRARTTFFCSVLIYNEICTIKMSKVSKVEVTGPTAHMLPVEWNGRGDDGPFFLQRYRS